MSSKELKDKEERLIEMYIKEYITKTQYFEMLKRIRNEDKKKR